MQNVITETPQKKTNDITSFWGRQTQQACVLHGQDGYNNVSKVSEKENNKRKG
jgi:hypothetical protein